MSYVKAHCGEAEIIQMTLENVRSFYSRNKDVTTSPMTDNFMWIGSNDFQWCEGLDEFYRITKNEYEEPPVLLSDEEYHLLLHERNIWVVYGRYKATAVLEDGSVIHAHVRGTYVWQRMDSLNADAEKIAFRDREGKHRFLFPDEILFLKAAGQHTIITTETDSFTVIGLLTDQEKILPPQFQRIQKSYLVNTRHIDAIYRYKAVLNNGRELPIGRNWYMNLKQFLSAKKENAEP